MFVKPVSSILVKAKTNLANDKVTIPNNSAKYLSSEKFVKPGFSNICAYYPNVSFGISKLELTPGLFKYVAAIESNPLWEKLISRETGLYVKPNELRSEFSRDYDRILHSDGYNRMMGKTQVFSNPNSDITSTRILHVNQVSSVAESIAEFLGLNVKLTRAIALGHDIGHTPFGHEGEVVINSIINKFGLQSPYWNGCFWHEKNSLRFLDEIETKLDIHGFEANLGLTYAVRDGIVSHCGEVHENAIFPRKEYLDLKMIQKEKGKTRPQPFTWEGCVVKISDKVAYLGKDIEDSIRNGFLDPKKVEELNKIIEKETGLKFEEINNTVLIGHFVSDLCANSSPRVGLNFSEPTLKMINLIKDFNNKNIYEPKDFIQTPFCDLAINTIFNALNGCYKGKDTIAELVKGERNKYHLMSQFENWLIKYSDIDTEARESMKYGNKIIYSIDNEDDYKMAIIDFISSLTDKTAKKFYEEATFI